MGDRLGTPRTAGRVFVSILGVEFRLTRIITLYLYYNLNQTQLISRYKIVSDLKKVK